MKDFISAGKAVMGIEFGSTRIKAVLVDDDFKVIAQGAQLLGWELDDLLSRTLEAMKPDEAAIIEEVAAL